MLNLFGRKRRSVKKTVKKPAKRLLAICKKYGVKTTLKRGTKRVYKSTAVLRKVCMKKNRMAFGQCQSKMQMQFGMPPMRAVVPNKLKNKMLSGARRTSKAAAMRAFRTFYKRNCRGNKCRRSGFGDGGNPELSMTMGSEFCRDGTGVLGPNSTGLFPSPCGAFGKRRIRRTTVVRRRRRAAFGKRRRRRTTVVRRRRRAAFGRKTRKTRRSTKRRVGRPRKARRSTKSRKTTKRRVGRPRKVRRSTKRRVVRRRRAAFGRHRRVGRPRKVRRSSKRRVVHRKRRVVRRRRNLFGF